MKNKIIAFIVFFIFTFKIYANNRENIFYLTFDINNTYLSNEQINSLEKNAKFFDILAPQIYQLDANGLIWGNLDSRLLYFAKTKNVKIMPLIIEQNFDQVSFHSFLHNPLAQENALLAMTALCEQYQLYGLQFDFENIKAQDKKEFMHFFKLAAKRLHKKGFIISIAVLPPPSKLIYSDYVRWLFENWNGVFDYAALGQSADFISLMSYDQHTSLTTPGPVAAQNWVEKSIERLLKFVPMQKISLGIPTYSGYWSTGKINQTDIPERYQYRSKEIQIGYEKSISILNEFNQSLVWNEKWKSFYVMYDNNGLNEFLFIEEVKSFQAKLALVEKYHLRGISVWKLGLEDPKIWRELK